MSTASTMAFTTAALVAFASNSLLCRVALRAGLLDAATFTNVRLVSGALALSAIVGVTRRGVPRARGSWLSAVALFLYAAPFSFAYVELPAGLGALILFGVVQTTMIGWGAWRGERPRFTEIIGLLMAVAGLATLSLPGATAPRSWAVAGMIVAGVAWGIYSLRGRATQDPLASTAGNFLRSLVLCVPLALFFAPTAHTTARGVWLAIASGAVASGVGYAFWYASLRRLTATRAAILQLLVPVLAAAAGIALLGERLTLRLVLGGCVMLAGVAFALLPARAREA